MRERKAKKVTIISFITNVLLTSSKLAVGVVGKSGAMVADGIHSLSDLITDIIVYISIHISSKPADSDHNYGHGKFETLATFIVSVALFIAGFSIFRDGATDILNLTKGVVLEMPSSLVLYVAIVSVISKEILFRYTITIGKKIKSDAIIANAWHQRSDAISSLGVLISSLIIYIFGSQYAYFDSIAQILVSLFLFKVAIKILKPALNQLIESSLDEESIIRINKVLKEHNEVLDYHHLRTRKIGNNYSVDVHILVSTKLNVIESHNITIELETKLKQILGDEAFISIHVEPFISQ